MGKKKNRKKKNEKAIESSGGEIAIAVGGSQTVLEGKEVVRAKKRKIERGEKGPGAEIEI